MQCGHPREKLWWFLKSKLHPRGGTYFVTGPGMKGVALRHYLEFRDEVEKPELVCTVCQDQEEGRSRAHDHEPASGRSAGRKGTCSP